MAAAFHMFNDSALSYSSSGAMRPEPAMDVGGMPVFVDSASAAIKQWLGVRAILGSYTYNLRNLRIIRGS